MVEKVIPTSMKGELDHNLWALIRNQRTCFKTAPEWKNTFRKLQRHFFQKADKAMKELSELLLEPILKECPGFQKSLQGGSSRKKPVRGFFFPFNLAYFHRQPFSNKENQVE